MTELADLTPRQIAVAALVAKAWGDKAIAAELHMSPRRVRVHITAVAYLCGFDPQRSVRIQLALWYRERVPIRHAA